MNHTPGPWHWDSDLVKGDPLNRRRYQVTTIGKTITQLYRSSGDLYAEADARLIAVAPELLDSLSKLVEMYVGLVKSGDCGNWDPETDAEVINARAAIAKAEGKL